MNFDALSRVDMLLPHEPTRLVGANRDHRKIDTAQARGNVGKVF